MGTLPQKEHLIQQDLEIPLGLGTTNDHIFSCTSYSGHYTQELNPGIDDAELERREEEPGVGRTNSRKNSRV